MLITISSGAAAYLAYRACTEACKFLSNLGKKKNK